MSATVALRDVCAFITKGATPTTYGLTWQKTGVPFLRSECVSDTGLDMRQSMYISVDADLVLRRSQVADGDILMTITGNVGRVVRLTELRRANINQHIARIRVKDPRVDPQFVYHYLSQPGIREYYESIVTGQAYPQISLVQVRETRLPLLPLSEQRQIAEALSDADGMIESLERLITKKQAIKQGMMQELLTGRTRLPGFTDPWRSVRLRDSGSTYGGLTGKDKDDFGTGSASYVTFLEVMASARLLGQRLERVSVRPGERQNQVKRGDILFNGSSETPEEVALAAVVDYDPAPQTYLNSFCFGYRLADARVVDPLYLAYFFRSGGGRRLIASLAQGATRYNISKTKLLELSPSLPRLDEQRAIVGVLRTVEAEIELMDARLQKARLIKQGMMQELLTGRTRLPVREAVA
ncbi:MAG: restriction endonuclease subunit S [Actinomycetota bacterium]|nr:restriction endonuclease subunit S [Actinomycetota bacterium]